MNSESVSKPRPAICNPQTIIYFVLLALVLLAALYLRLDNLGSVQRWTGDQSRDYETILRWKREGIKFLPLLGPYRMVGQDYALGPGWFFTIAPVLWLTDFNLSAGAAFMGVFAIVTLLMFWYWVRRSTGSPWAALAMAAVFAFAYNGINDERILWNPHVVPFGVAALLCLIDGIERRPVPCLALFMMLLGIMPQWHSTCIPVLLAAIPLVIAGALRARGNYRATPRRVWIGWGLTLLIFLAIIYVPPIYFELHTSRGNMRTYIQKTFIPSKIPLTDPLWMRLFTGADRLIQLAARQAFFPTLNGGQIQFVRVAGVAALLIFLFVYGRLWRREGLRRTPLGPAFLLLIVVGFWVIVVLKGPNLLDYFLYPALAPPIVLAGWTAGQLVGGRGQGTGGRGGRLLARGIGWGIILLGLTLTGLQLPQAMGIPKGRISYGFDFRDSRKIAQYIVDDAGGKPTSMLYLDSVDNSRSFMHVLMRILGLRTTNSNQRVSLRHPSPRENLGQQVYLIARGKLDKEPQIVGPGFALDPPVRVADAWIYRIPTGRLPGACKALWTEAKPPKWCVDVVTVDNK